MQNRRSQNQDFSKQLQHILNSSKSWKIVKQNGKLFCISKRNKYDITMKQQELVEILKQSLIFQFNSLERDIQRPEFKYQFFQIQSNFQNQEEKNPLLNIQSEDDLLAYLNKKKFEKSQNILKKQPKQNHFNEYLQLITELAVGREEFELQISNPFSNQALSIEDQIITETMNICQLECYEYSGWKENETFNMFFQLLTNQQKNIIVEKLKFKINVDADNFQFGGKYCCDMVFVTDARRESNLKIQLDKLVCNKLYISSYNKGCIQFNTDNIQLDIIYPIKKLKISLQQYEFNQKFNIDISFKDNSCYISKMVIYFINCKSYFFDSQSSSFSYIDMLRFSQISEYIFYFYSSTLTFNKLINIDQNCEKIIYFRPDKTEFKYCPYRVGQPIIIKNYILPNQDLFEQMFVDLRNKVNAMKFQAFSFHLFLSQQLTYSPQLTLLDLYIID